MDATTAILLDGNQLAGFMAAVLAVGLRVGAMLMAMPLIGTRMVPMRVRFVLAVAISAMLTPVLPPAPVLGLDAISVLTIARELGIGVCLGFILRLAFEAGSLAGELVAQGMALAFAQMADPARGMASGVVGQWFYLALGLLFFAFEGHLAVLELVVNSYRLVPIGQPLAEPGVAVYGVVTFLSDVLLIGARIALPLMIAMLVVNLSFGVLAKAEPQLNPLQIGLPAALFTGMVLLGVLAGELLQPMAELFDLAFRRAGSLFG